MKVEFRESFLHDLRTIKNAKLPAKIRAAIENAETADTPQQIHNFKN